MKQSKRVKFKALVIRQPDQATELTDKINDVTDNPENVTVTGKYYQVEELPPLMPDLDNSLSFFYLNISSLPFHFEELYTLLTSNNLMLDILCISGIRLKLNKTSLTSISLPDYNIEYTTTESNIGGNSIELKQSKKVKFKALVIRQPDQSTELIDKINDVTDNPENVTVTGKYYQVEELPPLMPDLDNSLSFFYLNISSLPFHFEELYTLLTSNNLMLDILCISGIRLKLNKTSLTSISLPDYNIEYTTTESNIGGNLIYIKNGIKYKLRKDLQIYKNKEL